MLTDCIRNKPEECELLIVPDFGSEKVKCYRDRNTQAVLPALTPEVDVLNEPLDVLLDDELVKDIICTLGMGFACDEFIELSMEKLRYHRIVIVRDGFSNSRILCDWLLRFFRKSFRPLILLGHVWICTVPNLANLSEMIVETEIINPVTRRLTQVV